MIAHSAKTLSRLQKQEEKVYRNMLKSKDSLQAKEKLSEIAAQYGNMRQKISSNPVAGKATQYIPRLDSLSCSLKFLSENGVSGNVKEALAKADGLKDKFQQAEELKKFISERKAQLKTQLENLGLLKNLKKFNKQAYYYSAQIKEYREMLGDEDKLQRKALQLIGQSKAFSDFMQRNSQLAAFFRMPGANDPNYAANMAGLQTSAQVTSMMQQQIASGGPNAQQEFQQTIQQAQSQLLQLKDKIPSGGSSDDEMPNFKPNNQKTKSLLDRLEYGFNLQTQKAHNYFPNTSDIGLSLGYKLNDKSVIGVGASYKMGLGNGWRNIRLSSEGAGIRSYVDYQCKGSIWLSGGFEMNYRTAFDSFNRLRDIDMWQQSGLLGLSKKYKVGKMKGKMQLLWDFLSYRQTPRTQPIVFRLGYNLK